MGIFENDWIMGQIKGMTDIIGRVVLNSESTEIIMEDELGDDEVKIYYHTIKEFIKEKKYTAAMQHLQTHFAKGNMDYLRVALSFFDELNALSEEQLKEGEYSRNALYRDLDFITKQYGIQL